MNSFAAFGCAALAKAEMQQPEPAARIMPTCLGKKSCRMGRPFFASARSSSSAVETNCTEKRPPTSQVSKILRSSEKVTPALVR